MSQNLSDLETRRFVLSGKVEDARRRFILRQGVNRIGCLPANEVVLPAQGVSKRHALLVIRPEQLSVEDLASKNGTYVNGEPIESTRIQSGDVIRFGKITLRLDEINPLEGELAFVLEDRGRRPMTTVHRDTSPLPSTRGAAGAGKWLRLVESFVDRLSDESGGNLFSSLALLAASLGARGACCLELADGAEPTVIACSGNLDELPSLDRSMPVSRNHNAIDVRHFHPPAAEGWPTTAAVGPDSGTGSLALVVWGRSTDRPEIRSLLRALLRVCEAYRPPRLSRGTELRNRDESRTLSYPQGYVRCESPSMTALYRQIGAVARSDVPVLILGETGVGKEAIARILHGSSSRHEDPFVAINCAAIPADLLEAELFGIGKGVATGVAERQGKFQLAEGGTLFLDEVGDMSQDLQAKLLRTLEEKEIQPVGGRPRPIHVRIVAATNILLNQRIEEGAFRSDLYYRLAGFELTVPPLRDRKEDIPLLAEHFLRTAAEGAGKSIRGVTLGAMRGLVERPWPGNVRELAHEMTRWAYLCPDRQAIDSSLLAASPTPSLDPVPTSNGPDPVKRSDGRTEAAASPPSARLPGSLDVQSIDRLHLAEIEEQVVLEALRRCRDNRTQAARLLGISREALRRRLARFDRARDARS